MRNPVLTIFYQYNPWHSTIGGIQTFISTFIKYAPTDFEIRLVGTGYDPDLAIGQWHPGTFEGRELQFMPLFWLPEDNVRKLIPTSVKYTLTLMGKNLASDFMHFYRIEPTLATRHWSGEKTLFIQNDIHKQVLAKEGDNAILWRRFPAAYFALERQLVGQFDQIYSCNSDSAELYRRRYPNMAERVRFLNNTVDQDRFFPGQETERQQLRRALAQQLGLPEETQFILFAGRLHPQKDPLRLVGAIAALNHPQAHLLMAGEGELAERIRQEIQRLNLSQHITLLGAVNPPRLAELHRLSQAFVLTSAYEGLPFAALEALASGTPVVTTPAGETPRLLTPDSGIVCVDRTPQTIAQALRHVLQHPDQYPVAACVQVAQPFGAQQVIHGVYADMRDRWQAQAHRSSAEG
ncbi:glycosyltransferase [Synechococcales cyanobacterium C]|uniref:Glycosyltransferase n=1 Tax=Petrachloros mirabilis ULC683 TaxID=2781853 RepID=A0A8K2A814_9CYAN|nr:glycosyltransferase [Petrachloros mirabilis]NCJ07491.1 glycosyltransferase [Petrachloros mirabilis ULC683]